MDTINKKSIRNLTLVMTLIIFTLFLRFPLAWRESPILSRGADLLYSLIYLALFIIWGITIKRRIIQEQTLKFLLLIVGLMLFWLMARTIRHNIFPAYPDLQRWSWYAYYIPMITIPLIGIFVSLSLGKPDHYRLPRWIHYFYIPILILIIFVLTNDFHQLVFKFPDLKPWTSKDYRYGKLYWFIWVWMIISVSL